MAVLGCAGRRVSPVLFSARLMSDYANYHPGFGSLFSGRRLVDILSTLMGEEAVLFKEKVSSMTIFDTEGGRL